MTVAGAEVSYAGAGDGRSCWWGVLRQRLLAVICSNCWWDVL